MSQTEMATSDEIRSVACPNCQAPAGEPCTTPTNAGRRDVSWHHDARFDAYRGW